jgi:hypothetical protein
MSMPSLQGLKKRRPKIAGRMTNATKESGDNENSSSSRLFISCVLGCHVYTIILIISIIKKDLREVGISVIRLGLGRVAAAPSHVGFVNSINCWE